MKRSKRVRSRKRMKKISRKTRIRINKKQTVRRIRKTRKRKRNNQSGGSSGSAIPLGTQEIDQWTKERFTSEYETLLGNIREISDDTANKYETFCKDICLHFDDTDRISKCEYIKLVLLVRFPEYTMEYFRRKGIHITKEETSEISTALSDSVKHIIPMMMMTDSEIERLEVNLSLKTATE